MRTLVTIFFACSTALGAFSQSAPKWQTGTITEVKIHQAAEKAGAADASYDVSIKVGDTTYVVLYTPPLREETVKYMTGREMLVLVSKNTIRYNDMLGQPHDLPIESHKPAANTRGSKQAVYQAQ
jgi:hypothetical protein